MSLDRNEDRQSYKQAIIALLLKLAESDGEWDSRELKFIRDIGYKMGLETHEVAEINADLENFKLKPPKSENERMEIMYYLLFFMKVDGKVTRPEEEMVKEVGLRLGIRPELTEELIDIIKDHIGKEVPVDRMLSLIKKYLN